MGPIKWRPRLSIRDTCNAVKGTYVSPENAYQQADVPAYMQDADHGYVTDEWLAEDNGNASSRKPIFRARITPPSHSGWQRSHSSGRGSKAVEQSAAHSRRIRRLRDTIQLTHAHYGWENKTFEVLSSRTYFGKGGEAPPYVELDIAETDPSIYYWTPTEQLTPQGYLQPNNVGVRICTPPEQVIAYSGFGGLVNGVECPSTVTTRSNSTVVNSIWVNWATPNDANVVYGGHLEVQWQAVGSSTWTSFGKIDPSATFVFINNVTDGASYNVQVRLLTRPVCLQTGSRRHRRQ